MVGDGFPSKLLLVGAAQLHVHAVDGPIP
jgi:hypothetical protein